MKRKQKKIAFICSICMSVALPLQLSAQTIYWTGGGATDAWSEAANFSPSAALPSGATLTFSGLGGASVNDLSGVVLSGITFTSTAGAYSLGGNSVTMGLPASNALPVILNEGSVQQVLNFSPGSSGGIVVVDSLEIIGAFSITGSLTFQNNTDAFRDLYLSFVVGDGQTTSFSGSMLEADSYVSGTVNKIGGGTLILSGTNAARGGAGCI